MDVGEESWRILTKGEVKTLPIWQVSLDGPAKRRDTGQLLLHGLVIANETRPVLGKSKAPAGLAGPGARVRVGKGMWPPLPRPRGYAG